MHLLWDLDQAGVSGVTLESRHPERDDIKALGGFRNANLLSRNLRVDHVRARQEPLLWMADVVAGAVGDAVQGSPECLALLSTGVHVRTVSCE